MRTDVIPSLVTGRLEARLQALRPAAPRGTREIRNDPGLERERLREVAEEFEALLLEIMVKAMRKNVPESPIFERNRGREIFNEMLDSEYVRLMVDRGGLGISKLLIRQLEPTL